MTASIDLSSPFDQVNVNLIIKRLAIMGLPEDVIELIRIWLKERLFILHQCERQQQNYERNDNCQ